MNHPDFTTNSPRAWAYGSDPARLAVAADRLYHHAALCDATDRPQMARVCWQKFAEAAAIVARRPRSKAESLHGRWY